MPQYAFVALGSNTNVKSGSGKLYSVTAGAASGTLVIADSLSIGATPNYVTIGQSVPSNIAYIPLAATSQSYEFYGAIFQDGLTVAATSSAPVTVIFD